MNLMAGWPASNPMVGFQDFYQSSVYGDGSTFCQMPLQQQQMMMMMPLNSLPAMAEMMGASVQGNYSWPVDMYGGYSGSTCDAVAVGNNCTAGVNMNAYMSLNTTAAGANMMLAAANGNALNGTVAVAEELLKQSRTDPETLETQAAEQFPCKVRVVGC